MTRVLNQYKCTDSYSHTQLILNNNHVQLYTYVQYYRYRPWKAVLVLLLQKTFASFASSAVSFPSDVSSSGSTPQFGGGVGGGTKGILRERRGRVKWWTWTVTTCTWAATVLYPRAEVVVAMDPFPVGVKSEH